MAFKDDLAMWRCAEKEFVKAMIDRFDILSVEFPVWKFKFWDIKITTEQEGEKTYEIKSDRKAPETWNFVIETRWRWKASWIFTSKADYIVYNVEWRRWIQERWELIIRLFDTPKTKTVGGDGGKTEMYKIKCDYLPSLFYPLIPDEEESEWSDEGLPTEVSQWL